MDLKTTLTQLGIPEAEETFVHGWEDSMATLPAGVPHYLVPEYLTESASFCQLDSDALAAALEMAARIREDPALLRFTWHIYQLAFGPHSDHPWSGFQRWPVLEAALGERGAAPYLVVALGAVRAAREHDAALGIPEEITRAGLYDVTISRNRYGRFYPGRIGVHPGALGWLRNHSRNGLYRLGRFQYVIRGFGGQVLVYRHRETRQVLALSEPDLRFDAEGFRAHPEAQPDGVTCWQSTFEADGNAIVGHPILPEGVALRRRVRLAASAWEQALVRGDPVLEMHIPEGGGMTLDRCEDSMRQALEFFPRYFPDRTFKGFGCQSWIMNPEFARFYSPTCNMVRYQEEVYLYPYPWSATGGIFFIFDADSIDPATAPRDTSIRRAMADHLLRGGILRNGGMFYLLEEMPRFGTRAYRQAPLFDALRAGRPAPLAGLGITLAD